MEDETRVSLWNLFLASMWVNCNLCEWMILSGNVIKGLDWFKDSDLCANVVIDGYYLFTMSKFVFVLRNLVKWNCNLCWIWFCYNKVQIQFVKCIWNFKLLLRSLLLVCARWSQFLWMYVNCVHEYMVMIVWLYEYN